MSFHHRLDVSGRARVAADEPKPFPDALPVPPWKLLRMQTAPNALEDSFAHPGPPINDTDPLATVDGKEGAPSTAETAYLVLEKYAVVRDLHPS